MSRFAKVEQATTHFPNRVALSREQLQALGCMLDLDPALLFYAEADGVTPWEDVAGSTSEATGADRGTLYASASLRVLDALDDEARIVVGATGGGKLPAATYLLRARLHASAAVAADFRLRARNATDGDDFATRTVDTLVGHQDVELLFTIPADDAAAGDVLHLEVKKLTATANTVKVDFLSIIPADALLDAFGRIPRGGRVEHTYNVDGTVNASTIYDAAVGGSVVETVARTYANGELASKAQTRSGRTLTTTYTYTDGNLTKKSLSVS